jgi:pimeloyl-ACP methyl ester carboxylesterase
MTAEHMAVPYPKYPISDYNNRLLTRREQRREKKDAKGHHPYKQFIKKVGVTALTLTSLYSMDVAHGERVLFESHPEIIHISDNHTVEHSDQATVVSAGWGNLDSAHTATSLPAYGAEGSVWAIRYDNTGVNTTSLAEELVAEAKTNHVTQLSFSGHSMGGLVNLEIARKVYESDNGISVPYIVLDCTPSSIDAVRPEVRNNGYLMTEGLSHIPGARYSSTIRLIAEEAARYNKYKDSSQVLQVDLSKMLDATKTIINDKILNDNVASASLLESQFELIVAGGAKEDIMALGKDVGKPKPVLVFIRPVDTSADMTVDDAYSEKQFTEYAHAANLPLVVVKVPGIGHADPNSHPNEYNAALTRAVFPEIAKQEDGFTLPSDTYLSASSKEHPLYEASAAGH